MSYRLTQDEIDKCREAFERFDKDGSGSIDIWELRSALQSMGQSATDEELFQMMAEIDDNGSGSIDFTEFLRVLESQKMAAAHQDDDADTLDAFVALGGKPDKSGQISAEKLVSTIKAFGLTINIEKLIMEADSDRSGFIDYEEFQAMMSTRE